MTGARVLGFAFSIHGSAACLVEGGRISRAVNLERITRKKHAFAMLGSVRDRLLRERQEQTELTLLHYFAPHALDLFEVLPAWLEHLTGVARPQEAAIDLVVMQRVGAGFFFPAETDAGFPWLSELFPNARFVFDPEHHALHARQAFYCSPFEAAAVMTVDGRGEKLQRLGRQALSMTLGTADGNTFDVLSEVCFPSSVGQIYSATTARLGFGQEQDGNTMALASFGTSRFYPEIQDTYRLFPDGRFELELGGVPGDLEPVFIQRLNDSCPQRQRNSELTQLHMDWAHCAQQVTEDILVNAARGLYDRTGHTRLAIAGGVGLNCVANGRILERTPFEELYVMPNAGDCGLAAGAALYGYHEVLGETQRQPPVHDYLGRPYSETEIRSALDASGLPYEKCEDVAERAASLIASGAIIGWFQGGSEHGPRALGHRSILADPRTTVSKTRLDADIKRREWFRPYAPSVLAERADEYFESHGPSPFMLQAVQARAVARERTPAIVHIDNSARMQTVTAEQEPRYHRLISNFAELTGVPLVLNTSFNTYGEPMVERPQDALAAFLDMNLDALVVGDYLVRRDGIQPSAIKTACR